MERKRNPGKPGPERSGGGVQGCALLRDKSWELRDQRGPAAGLKGLCDSEAVSRA